MAHIITQFCDAAAAAGATVMTADDTGVVVMGSRCLRIVAMDEGVIVSANDFASGESLTLHLSADELLTETALIRSSTVPTNAASYESYLKLLRKWQKGHGAVLPDEAESWEQKVHGVSEKLPAVKPDISQKHISIWLKIGDGDA